jgi:hypothetical protein
VGRSERAQPVTEHSDARQKLVLLDDEDGLHGANGSASRVRVAPLARGQTLPLEPVDEPGDTTGRTCRCSSGQ